MIFCITIPNSPLTHGYAERICVVTQFSHWVGSHSLFQGIFPTQGSNPVSCITGRFFTTRQVTRRWPIFSGPAEIQGRPRVRMPCMSNAGFRLEEQHSDGPAHSLPSVATTHTHRGSTGVSRPASHPRVTGCLSTHPCSSSDTNVSTTTALNTHSGHTHCLLLSHLSFPVFTSSPSSSDFVSCLLTPCNRQSLALHGHHHAMVLILPCPAQGVLAAPSVNRYFKTEQKPHCGSVLKMYCCI